MPSPNLLNLNPTTSKSLEENIEKHHLTISAVAKLSIILVQIIFVVLLGMNSATVTNVGNLENQIRNFELQLQSKSETTNQIQNVIRKTEKLKALQTQRPELGEKVSKAFNFIPPQVRLIQASVRPASMEVVVETQSPIEAALLINTYFSQNLASEVAINNANLSTSTGRFITGMEVTFR